MFASRLGRGSVGAECHRREGLAAARCEHLGPAEMKTWEEVGKDKPFPRETQRNAPSIGLSAASQKCLPGSPNPARGRCQHRCSPQGTPGSCSPRAWLRAGLLQEGKNRVGEQKLCSSGSFNSALMASLPAEPLILS